MSDLARDQDSGTTREQWREYDDSKFARVEDELPENVEKTAYLVFYERCPSDTIDLTEDVQCGELLNTGLEANDVEMEELPAEGDVHEGRKAALEEDWNPEGVIQGRVTCRALLQDAKDTGKVIEVMYCDPPPLGFVDCDADGDALMSDP